MPLYNPLDGFPQEFPPSPPVELGSEIPEEMDIFYRTIEAFLPDGKELEDLTPEELNKIKAQYRFDHYRPGVYQGITGFGNMV
jgi:hypothetical protein